MVNPQLHFAQSQCERLLEHAFGVYADDLPDIYPLLVHEAKVHSLSNAF